MYQDRRNEIIKLLREIADCDSSSVSIRTLAKKLGVSDMTIRRDVQNMEKNGEIIRSFGGISLNTNDLIIFSPPIRANNMPKEKKMIAELASNLIVSGQNICIGTGSTLLYLAKIAANKNVIITTPSISAAMNAAKGNSQVYLTGGNFNFEYMETTGASSEMLIRTMNFDITFVSAAGVSLKGGVSEFTEAGASLSRTMCECATTKVLLADRTKFNVTRSFKVIPLESFDYIVTDALPEKKVLQYCNENNVEVIFPL